MDVRRRIYTGIARQFGHPAGLAGRLVGVALNLGDRRDVTAAVDALTIPPRGVVADVGFGGGVGIALLLDRAGARGKVHGVDVSSEMLSRAARRFREEISAGRLELHRASMYSWPHRARRRGSEDCDGRSARATFCAPRHFGFGPRRGVRTASSRRTGPDYPMSELRVEHWPVGE